MFELCKKNSTKNERNLVAGEDGRLKELDVERGDNNVG